MNLDELKEKIKKLIDECYSTNALDFIMYVLTHWHTDQK